MNKLSIEVRTLYTVEITFSEWWKIFAASDTETIEEARERFKLFAFAPTNDDMQKLSNALGFDGWENSGYINNKNNYVCVLRNRGCTI